MIIFQDDSYNNMLVIIIDKSLKGGLLLNEVSLNGIIEWSDVSNSSMVAGNTTVTDGVYRIRHQSPISTFALFLYGVHHDKESYAFPAGMRVAPFNSVCILHRNVFYIVFASIIN